MNAVSLVNESIVDDESDVMSEESPDPSCDVGAGVETASFPRMVNSIHAHAVIYAVDEIVRISTMSFLTRRRSPVTIYYQDVASVLGDVCELSARS